MNFDPHRFPRLPRLTSLFATLLLLLAAGARLASAQGPSLLNPTSLEWTLASSRATAMLTLVGPRGDFERHTFAKGHSPTFSVFDSRGASRPEGLYTWELVAPTRSAERLQTTSGTFRIVNGSITLPDAVERKRDDLTRDQTVADDLIVQGSTCVGLDCANGEVFGTDNVRLKANVLRLRFDDTSATSGFPATDWQLTANDAGSGGANKFSLEDTTTGTTPFTVRGGAPNNAIFVDATGRVGYGTATPSAQLHLFGTDAGVAINKILVENANTGTGLPREMFELRNHGSVVFIFDDTTEPERWGFSSFAHRFLLDNQNNAGLEFDLGPTGNLTIGGTLTQSSDRDAKSDILAVEPSTLLAKVAKLPISTWRYKTDPENVQHLGPMAQDFSATFGLGADDKHIAPGDMAGVSLAAIQALVAEVQDLRVSNEKLASELAAIRARLIPSEISAPGISGQGGRQ